MKSRWIVLAIASFVVFGNYYAYDIPASTSFELELLFPNDFPYYLQLFYSLYSIPNLFIPFASGYLMQTVGLDVLLPVLALLVAVGQLLFTLGVFSNSLALMVVGRLFLGVGGESLGVAQYKITSSWFADRELAFALGMNICAGRVGSVLNDLISPWLAAHLGATAASLVAALFCLVSLGLAWLLAGIEKRREWESEPDPEDHDFVQGILQFTAGFWLANALIMVLEGVMITFNNVHAKLLEQKFYRGDNVRAAQVIAIPDIMSAVLVPPLGYVVDRLGHRAHFLCLCCALLGAVHFCFWVSPGNSHYSPIPLLFLLGISNCLTVTVWATIPLFVTERDLGSAFGVATSTCNLALVVYPMVVAAFESYDASFGWVEGFFTFNALLGTGLCVWMMKWDSAYNNNGLVYCHVSVEKNLKDSYDSLDEDAEFMVELDSLTIAGDDAD
ncbi:hypothetical protein HDU91_001667 [Kappamyces sp. JEL0680]|nr:hypothetical protein HDU91_001667 [Kappamyces sp. JEL0680]